MYLQLQSDTNSKYASDSILQDLWCRPQFIPCDRTTKTKASQEIFKNQLKLTISSGGRKDSIVLEDYTDLEQYHIDIQLESVFYQFKPVSGASFEFLFAISLLV